MEFEQLNLKEIRKVSNLREKETWSPPPDDVYKINVDASFHADTKKGGWGFIIRDSAGDFLEGGAGNIPRAACPLQAEALAALYSLQHASHLGMTKVILETDAFQLGCALKSAEMDRSPYGALFMQVRELMYSQFRQCNISVCSRICNKVADCMATYGACVLTSGSQVFMSQVPSFVFDLVSGDKPGAGCQ